MTNTINDPNRLLPAYAEGADRAFVAEITQEEEANRFPDLFSHDRYSSGAGVERHFRRRGINGGTIITAVYEAQELTDQELAGVRKYSFAQYLQTGYFDPTVARANGMQEEPVDSYVKDGDIVVVAGTPDGQIMNMAKVTFGSHLVDSGLQVGDYANRSTRFGPELLYGEGVYQDCAECLGVDAGRVADMERFVARQTLSPHKMLYSSLEIGLALMNVVDIYREKLDMVTGDLEEGIAGKYFDSVLKLPIRYLSGVPDYRNLRPPYNELLKPRYEAVRRGQKVDVRPFVMRLDEISRESWLIASFIDMSVNYEGYRKGAYVATMLSNMQQNGGRNLIHMPTISITSPEFVE